MNSAHALIEKLVDKNLTIGAVESFTGGLFGKTLTDVPGSSKAFKGSLVTYSDESKVNILGIPEEFIKENCIKACASISETCQQMAIKGQKLLNVDICVAFTGNAGPDVCQDGTAVGEVYMSIVYKGQAWPIPLKLEMTREELRKYCVETAVSAISSII